MIVTVVSGDTLSGIAAAHGADLGAVEAANPGISNPNVIYVGEQVIVPAGGSWTSSTSSETSSSTPSSTDSGATAGGSSASSGGASPSSIPSGGTQGCIAFRESTNGQASSNIYQFSQNLWSLAGMSGSPGSASVAQQNQAYQNVVNGDINGGLSNWTPYDGC